MKFVEKKIKCEDIQVAYIDEGEQKGMPLIFIHGFPFNKWMWENQVQVFQAHTRVLAYDVRGFGNTDTGNDEYSIELFSRDLFCFMDALKIEKAVICGLSMGGYIALNALELQPKRIAAVILADTQCAADSDDAKQKRADTISAIGENGLLQYTQESVKKLFCENSFTYKQEEILKIKHTIQHTRTESIIKGLKALAGRKDMCTTLSATSIPVLIMVGQHDQITSPQVAQKMHELVASSILHIIPNAGHVSNMENANSFNLALLRFLTDEAQIA